VWGGIAAVLAVLASFFKFDIAKDVALQLDFVDWALSGVAFLGGALAIWGRIKATKRIE